MNWTEVQRILITCLIFYMIAWVKGWVNWNIIIQVPTGYVGVEYRLGKLLDTVHSPGFSMISPLSHFHLVQTSVQTDEVQNIPCGTKGGVMIHFKQIEVINILDKDSVIETVRNYTVDYDRIWIYNKVHHEINQYCSKHTLEEVYITDFDQLDENLMAALQESAEKWAPGIKLLSIRVTKPIIPDVIGKKYIEIEQAKATEKILVEKHHTILQKQETELQKKLREKERGLDVLKINLTKEIEKRKMDYDIAKIENEIATSNQISQLNSWEAKEMTKIDGLTKKLNVPTMKKMEKESLLNNSKLFIGDSIPRYISMDNRRED